MMAELPLALFTTLAPIGAGAFIALAVAFFTTKFSDEQLKKIDRMTTIPVSYTHLIQTEHGIAWIRIVPCHQRSRRMGRSVPVFTHELPNPGGHVLVLLDAIARVLAVLPCQRRRSVLLPRTYAPLHGDARKRAIPARLVLPYRSHILARRRSSTGDRRRLASRLGVGRLPVSYTHLLHSFLLRPAETTALTRAAAWHLPCTALTPCATPASLVRARLPSKRGFGDETLSPCLPRRVT